MDRRSFLLGTATLLGSVQISGITTSATAHAAQKPTHTGLVYEPDFLRHQTGAGHPESPKRVQALIALLKENGLYHRCQPVAPLSGAIDAHLLKLHTRAHILSLQRNYPNSEWVARRVVAGMLAAVDAVCSGRLRNAFCASRPPGHHALNTGDIEGFCLYNSIALAARYAHDTYGLERILIADWDYHHGNSTQAMFYDDPGVLYFSTHDQYAYPGTGSPLYRGTGQGLGYNINVHLDCGSSNAALLAAFEEQLLPVALRYQPQLVLISAGFDSRADDPLGCFEVDDEGFSRLTRMLMELADHCCDGRLISMLEGGYHIQGNASAASAHLHALQY